jgi:hypothetical protein
MAYINTFDPTTPTGANLVSQGDDRIREIKAALIERIESMVLDIDADPWTILSATSITALATPAAMTVTTMKAFASTVSGAVLMGYGTTNDVALMNRAGTVCLGVGPNTTVVNIPGSLSVVGAIGGGAASFTTGLFTSTSSTALITQTTLSGTYGTTDAPQPHVVNTTYTSASAISSGSVTGFHSQINYNSAAALERLYGVMSNSFHNGAGNIALSYGYVAEPQNSAGGTIGYLTGIILQPIQNGTGTVTMLRGAWANNVVSAVGAVTTSESLFAGLNASAASTIGTHRGLRVDTPYLTGGATIGTNYGIHIYDQRAIGGTANWALYSDGGDVAFRNAKVAVGGGTLYYPFAVDAVASGCIARFTDGTHDGVLFSSSATLALIISDTNGNIFMSLKGVNGCVNVRGGLGLGGADSSGGTSPLRVTGFPTSAAGLVAGDVWVNAANSNALTYVS